MSMELPAAPFRRALPGACRLLASALSASLLSTACLLPLPLAGPAGQERPAAAAPSLVRMEFTPPVPGSYSLNRIMRAPDGAVLDSDGSEKQLGTFTTGQITLFSFIYTYCSDPKGCPLAYETLHTLKSQIEADAMLRDKIRFVSMSFDPDNDTPLMMRSYGGQDARDTNGLRWHFLTSRSRRALLPVLDGFGQDVSVAAEPDPGSAAPQRVPVLRHMLKVFLIDRSGWVREIYSTSFLMPQVLMNDIKTLLLEQGVKIK